MNGITEIKIISNIMAFIMFSQILLSLFQSTQQHSKPIAKSTPPPKKDVVLKVFISLHFEEDQIRTF